MNTEAGQSFFSTWFFGKPLRAVGLEDLVLLAPFSYANVRAAWVLM